MASTEGFAKSELIRSGLFNKDGDYSGMIGEDVMEMVEVFSKQGHTGASAATVLDCFIKLVRIEPLTPLTGDQDEWVTVRDGLYQNARCSRVFKKQGGEAYDTRGRVFRYPSGLCFTTADSFTPVVFPYMPHTEIVDVPEREDS